MRSVKEEKKSDNFSSNSINMEKIKSRGNRNERIENGKIQYVTNGTNRIFIKMLIIFTSKFV